MSTPRLTLPRHLPLRLPRICVALVGTNPGEMIEKAEAVSRENPFMEFRLDYLSKPALALPGLKKFLEYHSHVLAIATCRRAANGGKFRGTVQAEVDMLLKAAAAGCQRITCAALPDFNLDVRAVEDFHELHVRALGKTRVCLEQRPVSSG